MDYSVRRIDSNLARGVGPSRRRGQQDEGPEFDLELADESSAAPPGEPEPSDPTTSAQDTPVAPPEADDVGGRLDLTG